MPAVELTSTTGAPGSDASWAALLVAGIEGMPDGGSWPLLLGKGGMPLGAGGAAGGWLVGMEGIPSDCVGCACSMPGGLGAVGPLPLGIEGIRDACACSVP